MSYNNPKFKVGQIVDEPCGRSWKILKVNKKNYRVENTSDKDIMNWDIEDMEKHTIVERAVQRLLGIEELKLEYITALYGKKKTHLRYLGANNVISLCRWAENVKPATKHDFDKNPCLICQKAKEDYIRIWNAVQQIKANGMLDNSNLSTMKRWVP